MEDRKHLIAQAALTTTVLFAYFIALSRPRGSAVESLKRLSPSVLAITFFALVVLFILNARKIFAPWGALKRKQWTVLGLIGVLAFLLAFFFAPRTHRIYYDETIDLNIGQSIAYTGRAQMINYGEIKYGELTVHQGEYNKQPNAYPFLLSLLYRVFGCSETLSFLFNNFVFAFSALTIFGIAWLLFRDFRTGAYAALIWTVIPQNILWHNTTAAEPSNTLFLALAVFLALSAVRSTGLGPYFLAAVGACFAAQFRMESLLIVPLVLIIMGLGNRSALRDRRFYYLVPAILALLLVHAMHVACFIGHAWGAPASQDKFSLGYLGYNLKTNGLFFLNGKSFPVLLTAFAILGLLSKRFVPERLQLVLWFGAFWGVFLPFYAGSYSYGADVRFSLMTFPALAAMAGFGLATLDGAFRTRLKVGGPIGLSVIVVAFLAFAPRARTEGQEAWAARADHRYAREMLKDIPPNSLIFTHNPNMFLFWGVSSAQAPNLLGYDKNGLQGLRSAYPGGLYFHYNFWCNVSDPAQQNFCRSVLDRFDHREIIRFTERDYTYALYKLE